MMTEYLVRIDTSLLYEKIVEAENEEQAKHEALAEFENDYLSNCSLGSLNVDVDEAE